jgi:hypothetical protein
MVDVTSFNYYIGHREPHVLPEHIRYQTALDYKRLILNLHIPRRAKPDIRPATHPTTRPAPGGKRDQTLASESFPGFANCFQIL